MSNVTLSNGVEMPLLGLGTFQMGPTLAEAAVWAALTAGYRRVDTANSYLNERAVAGGMSASGVPRDDVFLSTKLWPTEYPDAAEAIDATLERLATDHVDLLYLHQPVGEVRTAWEAMEEAYAAGKVRALGLSNFSRGQVEEVLSYATVAPQVVTCESHPFAQREGFRRWLASRGIAMEAWFPLGHGSAELLREPTITDIAMAHGASPAQAILRWHVQRGVSVTPSTSKLEHIKENLRALSLELEEDEMAAIAALDRDEPFYVPTQEVLDGFLTRDLRFEEPREDPWYLR